MKADFLLKDEVLLIDVIFKVLRQSKLPTLVVAQFGLPLSFFGRAMVGFGDVALPTTLHNFVCG